MSKLTRFFNTLLKVLKIKSEEIKVYKNDHLKDKSRKDITCLICGQIEKECDCHIGAQ